MDTYTLDLSRAVDLHFNHLDLDLWDVFLNSNSNLEVMDNIKTVIFQYFEHWSFGGNCMNHFVHTQF